jgi:hypothetical protein
MPVVSQALVGITICYGWLVLPPGGIAHYLFNGLMMMAAFVVSTACSWLG